MALFSTFLLSNVDLSLNFYLGLKCWFPGLELS